jgi:hypothetical protein
VRRLSRQCGILNISQPYRPPRPVAGIVLLFFYRDDAREETPRKQGGERYMKRLENMKDLERSWSLGPKQDLLQMLRGRPYAPEGVKGNKSNPVHIFRLLAIVGN